MNDGPDCFEAQVCRGDFYEMLREALEQCHGSNDQIAIERYQKMKLEDIVNVLAQNGIRMVYIESKHINHEL